MEQKNLFLAISLSILVFITWNYFFTPVKQPPIDEPTIEKEVSDKKEISDKPVAFDKSDIKDAITTKDLKITAIKTPLYQVQISNDGAVFKSFKLTNYKESNDENARSKELINQSITSGNYKLSFLNKNISGIDTAIFTVSDEANEIIVDNETKYLTYTWESKDGVIIEKTYEFIPDTYLINCTITLKNGSERTIDDRIALTITNKLSDKSKISFEGPSLLVDDTYQEIKPKNIEEENHFEGKIDWAAIHDRYFMISILPESKSKSSVNLSYNEDKEIINAQLVQDTGTIVSGTQKIYNYKIVAGPKSLSLLKSIGYNIDKIVNFGWFDFIAKPCLMLMNYIYDHIIKNYGIAIIILTIIFKIIVWPLGTKSYKSMNEMKKLQPLVAELKEKYPNDRQKMNEEMMALYRTYKVNPLSGCLPMLVQMPIFFAFYKMLYSAIELRHAPFFGWIMDLSAPDRLFSFNFTIPFFEPPTGIPVLTLLMGASMFLQQKMSPPAGDPAQARMMMMMPVFMTFIFMNFSSGLVLYWLVNNIISIGQQYYIMKKNA